MTYDAALAAVLRWYRERDHVAGPVIPHVVKAEPTDGHWLITLRCPERQTIVAVLVSDDGLTLQHEEALPKGGDGADLSH